MKTRFMLFLLVVAMLLTACAAPAIPAVSADRPSLGKTESGDDETWYDLKVVFRLESSYGNIDLAEKVADIAHRTNEDGTKTAVVSKNALSILNQEIAKWDAVYSVVQSNAEFLQHPVALVPQIVTVSRSGPSSLSNDDISWKKEGGTIEVVYDVTLGGVSVDGFELQARPAGDITYLTLSGPERESGRAVFETILPSEIMRKAVHEPFLNPESAVPGDYSLGTAVYTEPKISTAESAEEEELLYKLNLLGRSGSSTEVGKIILYPRDYDVGYIEDQLLSFATTILDWKAARIGRPVTVSLIGYSGDYPIAKGYFKGTGGGANGSLSGDISGGALALWGFGGGNLDGSIQGSVSQDPINLGGSFSSLMVKELRIVMYFEN